MRKRNAIIRIVLYSLLVILLCGILISAFAINLFTVDHGNYTVSSNGSADAANVRELSINWAAGTITIATGDTDKILLSETGEFSDEYRMAFEVEDNKLNIDYSHNKIKLGLGSVPAKDLTITVPQDWYCNELELDAAAVEIKIDGLSVGKLELDCAAGEISFNGIVDNVDCDGAAMELELTCLNTPDKIDIDGATCALILNLPNDSGYSVSMDGLGCDFHSNVAFTGSDGNYRYGNEDCKVNIDGLGSEITINIAN